MSIRALFLKGQTAVCWGKRIRTDGIDMKNIILQHWTGKLGELEERSKENIQTYAKYCGADYSLLRGDLFRKGMSSPCQKLIMLDEQFDEYDTVVMMDIDMFTRKGMTKNIFTDDSGIGRHFNIQETLVKKLKQRFPRLGDPAYPYWGGSIYRLDREVRQRLRKEIVESEIKQFNHNYEDEGIMHRLAVRAKMQIDENTSLDKDLWNRSSFEEEVSEGYIIHIREKIKKTPGRRAPRQSKILNYRKLVKEGIL